MSQLTPTTALLAQPRALPRISPFAMRFGPLVAAVAVLLMSLVYVRWPDLAAQVDVEVYRFGAQRVVDGLDLYSVGLTGSPTSLLFDYAPFAALCFVPLTMLSMFWVQVLTLTATAGLVSYAVYRMLAWSGMSPSTGSWNLTALLVGLALWLEPIRLSAQLGQINPLILAVVAADLLSAKRHTFSGIGIGLVAGIKLTPALFIVYLWLIGRRRAAAVAAATFAATVALGFAVLPADSRFFWLQHGFDDIRRISSDLYANTSLHGLLVRLHWPAGITTLAAAALAVAGLAVAVGAWRNGHGVLGLACAGMTSAAASPFSWSHHWVWFVPLLVHLGHRGYVLRQRYSAIAMWALWLVLAGWLVSYGKTPQAGLLSFRPPGALGEVIASSYLAIFVTTLACTALWLRGGGRRVDAVDESAFALHE